jgi:hypothetical protein
MSRSIAILTCVACLAVSCGGPGGAPFEPVPGREPAVESDLDSGHVADEAEEHELPPVDAKPLSEIVRMLEEMGYAPVTEIEFENGVWEVEALHYGRIVEIAIDPVTGERVDDADGG